MANIPSEVQIEKHLQKKIFPDLERGRPGWDVPHTKSVVNKLKQILDNSPELSVDRTALLIAAYAHDWGYAGLFKGGKPLQLKAIGDKKILHMEIGSQKVRNLLTEDFFNFLSSARKNRVIRLVSNHDRLDRLKDTDELVLMEADTLGALDTSRATPTFNKDSNTKFMASTKETRIPRFITQFGKNEAQRLLRERENYYRGLSTGSDLAK